MIFSCRPDRGASWHLAQRPPACQLAPLLAQRRPPSCPGHRRARPHAPGPFPPGVPTPRRARSATAATRPCPSRLPTGSPAHPLDPFLPPWMFLPPGLPGGPPPPRRHAQVPPACQLARLSSRGMSLRVAPTSSISPSPAGCTTGRSAFTLVAPGVPGVSEPAPSTAPALPGSLMGVFSQIEPRIGLTLSDS